MNQALTSPPTLFTGFAVGVIVLVALALFIYHMALVRPRLGRLRALLELHDGLLAGEGGSTAAEWFTHLEGSRKELAGELERVARRMGELEALARTDISRVGFVRYNAFDDTGSELSYAAALLNREGDGIVLTSLYSRSDTRTYGKAVTKFVPVGTASEEELQAIQKARAVNG
ncbi:MAG TPA: DUF4446 family protein [Candidatus Tyrphobacter sp.]